MIVSTCQHTERRTNGKTKAGATRYRCKTCGKSWTESTDTLGGMRIGLDKAAQIIELLCEGNSVRGTMRISGADKNTILSLLTYVGERCDTFMGQAIRGVHVDSCQVDEIWQYVFCKKATAKRLQYVGGCGDSWTFTALDRDTKLILAWHMGRRTEEDGNRFMAKLAAATDGHMHVSTDGWRFYPNAVRRHLGHRCDHGVMTKIYGTNVYTDQRRYSPPRIIASAKTPIHGSLYQQDKICTSHVERSNGTIRHFTRRLTRLTCAFSKRWNNHRAALAVFFVHYNWCKKHRTLGTTPAMAHGLASERWSVKDLLLKVCAGEN